MKTIADVISRLDNHKFLSALTNIESLSSQDRNQVHDNDVELVQSIVTCFGNNPYVEGHLGDILRAAVAPIIERLEQANEVESTKYSQES